MGEKNTNIAEENTSIPDSGLERLVRVRADCLRKAGELDRLPMFARQRARYIKLATELQAQIQTLLAERKNRGGLE